MHDTIGCYLDIDKGQIKFSKNGKFYSLAFWDLYLDAWRVWEKGCVRMMSDCAIPAFRERPWPCIWIPTTYKEPGTLCSLCAEGNLRMSQMCVQDGGNCSISTK